MPEEKAVTFYLAGWQKRMIVDHVKGIELAKINKIKVSVIDKKQWVMYRQPVLDHLRAGEWSLYLTDEQISHVGESLGLRAKISALNISPEMIKSGAIAFM